MQSELRSFSLKRYWDEEIKKREKRNPQEADGKRKEKWKRKRTQNVFEGQGVADEPGRHHDVNQRRNAALLEVGLLVQLQRHAAWREKNERRDIARSKERVRRNGDEKNFCSWKKAIMVKSKRWNCGKLKRQKNTSFKKRSHAKELPHIHKKGLKRPPNLSSSRSFSLSLDLHF